jgi:3-dehydroquinate synthase
VEVDAGRALILKSGATSSQAIVEWGALQRLPELLHACALPHRLFIVTDAQVGALYAGPILNILQQAGFAPSLLTIPAGESSKSLLYWQQILDWLVENKAERQEPLVALGGGVVGDLTGFAAASYHRGIPLIQLPTTLLAQVDSAIGGKTGVNHPKGKNLIGAIYQPRLIVVDPSCLRTLPDRVYREGWAEIVKYGMILDADLFGLLETHASSLYVHKDDPAPDRTMDSTMIQHKAGEAAPGRSRSGHFIAPIADLSAPSLHDSIQFYDRAPVAFPGENTALLTGIIRRCIRLKMDVVSSDERESGLRTILNYGHTFGHALEALTDYGTWLHGEAVSIGMEVAAHIAVSSGLLSSEDALRQRRLLQAFGLPIHCPGLDSEALVIAMQRDKKIQSGRMRWVLPTHIGHAGIYDDIPLELVRDAINTVQAVQ